MDMRAAEQYAENVIQGMGGRPGESMSVAQVEALSKKLSVSPASWFPLWADA